MVVVKSCIRRLEQAYEKKPQVYYHWHTHCQTRLGPPGHILLQYMPLRLLLLHLLLWSFFGQSALAQNTTNRGEIRGFVRDVTSGEPLIGAHVRLIDTNRGAITNLAGHYTLTNVPAGEYEIEAQILGFSKNREKVVLNADDLQAEVHILLKEEAIALSEIVVSPGQHTIFAAEARGVQSLSGKELQRSRVLGEDVYRAVTRLPGLSASDFSSRFTVRGGEHDEVLVLFDGLELQDPFHLKDIGGGGLSIIDVGLIGGVDLMTGAFTAEYGDRLSGVFNITSESPDQNQWSLGLSLLNARALSKGVFKNDKTTWMLAGRRGYLDIVLDLTRSDFDFTPQYYDTFGKINHRFDKKHTVSVQWLVSGDRLEYRDAFDPNDRVDTQYGNAYLWSNWKAVWSSRLYSHTVLSYGSVWRDRNGVDLRNDGEVGFLAQDKRNFDIANLKQDWSFEASSHYLLKWGFNAKHTNASYTYANEKLVQEFPNPERNRYAINRYEKTQSSLSPRGTLLSAYASQRIRIGDRLITETGARYGVVSWSGDRYLDPRVNLAYQIHRGGTLRAGWGLFHQPQGIETLDVQDGDERFYSAQRSRHYVLGYESTLPANIGLRIDLYSKKIQNPRPRFASLAGDITSLFPELDDNRVLLQPESGRSRGFEVSLRKEQGRRFNWWGSYSLSGVEETIEGRDVPKSFDQRHAIYLEANYRVSQSLDFNLSWHYRSGWRYSDVSFEATHLRSGDVVFDAHYGSLNARRFPAYHRMNARISHNFKVKSNRVAAFLEVRNLYNRKNLRMYRYTPQSLSDGTVVMQASPQHWFPILPAFGLRWDVGRE